MPIPGPLGPTPASPYAEQHIWLGPVGNLQELTSLAPGTAAPISVPSVVHQVAGNGGRVVQRMGVGKRTYSFSGEFLTPDDLSILEAFYLGGYGPGPFVLMEPWRVNLLGANQSSGTDQLRDTTGFAANTGTITSSTVQAMSGSRSLAWAVTAATQTVGTGSAASYVTANPATDIPVLASTSYAAAVSARLGSSTGSLRMDVMWYTAAGAFISTSFGTAVALSTSAWTAATLVADSPATAALCRVRPTNSAMGAAQTIYLDQWQLAQSDAVPAWTMGTGVPRVSFTGDMGEVYPIWPNVSSTLELTEV